MTDFFINLFENMYIMFKPRTHCIFLEKANAEGDIYFFHGARSSAGQNLETLYKLSDKTKYNVIACDVRGRGSRMDWDKHDWSGTMADYRKIMKNRHLPKIFIGKSMGNSLAFSLAEEFKPKKIFAVGSPYDESVKDDWSFVNKIKYKKTLNSSKDLLPFSSQFSGHIHLIHSPQDSKVPISQMEKMAKKFNVPESRIKKISYKFTPYAHERSGIDKDTWKYVIDNIEDPSKLKKNEK